ncbi:MAG: prepilin-type N-terminal cleavage/methylation domain-containing protein [Candidatus Omnitrophota bacterium]
MKKGFTLIEITVTVVLVGILALIALPRFSKVIEKSRASEGILWLQVMRMAQRRYYADHGCYGLYASNVNDLDIGFRNNFQYFRDLIGALPPSIQLGSIMRKGLCYQLVIFEDGTIQCSTIIGNPYTCADIGM